MRERPEQHEAPSPEPRTPRAQDPSRPPLEEILAIFQRASEAGGSLEKRERLSALRSALEPLQPLAEKYGDYYHFIEPSGAGGRPVQEEFDAFLARRADDPAAVPSFTYPNLERLDTGNDAAAVAALRAQYEALPDPHVRAVALHALRSVELTFELLSAMRAKNDARVFEVQRELFGGLRPATIDAAHAALDARGAPQEGGGKSPVLAALEQNTYGAEEIRAYFERACRVLHLEHFTVTVSPSVSAITVKLHPAEGGGPAIFIPPSRVLNGHQLLRLIAHEIGTHAVTNENALRLGLPLTLGPEYELFQEGLAKHAERSATRAVSGAGENSDAPDDDLLPYNVLALERVQQGGNFRDVFEHVLGLRAEVWLRKHAKKRPAPTIDDAKKQPSLIKATLVQCRRLFRGFHDLSVGGRAFFKDKMYFEGALLAQEMDRAGVTGVLRKAKIDPWIAEHLLQTGVLEHEVEYLAEHIATVMLRGNERDLTRPRWERAYEEFLDLRESEPPSPRE